MKKDADRDKKGDGRTAPPDPEEQARKHKQEEFRRVLLGRIGAAVISVLILLLGQLVGWLGPIIAFFAGVGMFMTFSWLWTFMPAIREAVDRKKGGSGKDG